ncbi:MAG: Spx/MgsR family RNA polymerase-binding regulatory protein [Erysipelotrichia bacterium]|nr:Spx/MgsR family RNA polymerase-binding regulatory protein [Erysipelotrichia bacterium]
MILIYTSFGCTSATKAKQWLDEKKLPYVEKNIQNTLLNKDEIKYILTRCPNGTEDIISKRSKAYQCLNHKLDDLSINDLVDFIQKNPTILKRPIIINEDHFVVGFDDDEITSFVPGHLRKFGFKSCCKEDCEHYQECQCEEKEVLN